MMSRIFWLTILAAVALRGEDRCAGLRSLTSHEFSIATAVMIPATGNLPEHCRVIGQILPEVQFEVNLPAKWSGSFLMVGNGGYAGEPVGLSNRDGQRARAMGRGFALAATNTGHDAQAEPLGTFASNPQKMLDYAFRAVHVTAVTAKQIVAAYYGRAPQRSYFEGCSTGGRQGLIAAQRFPQDFDGIVVGAPVLNFTGTMVMYAWMARALAAAPLSSAKMKLVADRVYALCDEKDGLKDGLIDDPRRCDFSPKRDLPVCAGEDAATCFTQGQIASLEAIYGGVQSQGKTLFPGWPVGAEIADVSSSRPTPTGWNPWIIRDDGTPIGVMFAETFFQNMAFRQRDPKYDMAKFNFEKDPVRLDHVHRVLDATDPDLSAFKARNGKMVMYYGWADPGLNAMMGVNYYEDVMRTMGDSTTDFYRLFMVPGMFHCGGGVGPDRFDALAAVTEWVEKGKAPEQMKAAQMAAGKEVRTRPLCPYPEVALYKGSGSNDDAANFTCGTRR
jgi:feruloyl esterase